ncbi:MAG: Domain amino terminal to FKBP-type peptidyl-prolyl isomerase, partial [Bacteroidetes bacterium]|nr:Domain amino terminal to FKBP-type peptidyl-prolyl isomerase [Bacteroidota bacterium]
MKIRGLVVPILLIAIMLGSCGKSIQSSKIKTKEDSLSYAFGIVNYNALKTDSLKLNPMVVAKAMLDGEEGKPAMSGEIARGYIMMFLNKRETEMMAKQAELNKETYKVYIAENEAFLAKNKEKTGVI